MATNIQHDSSLPVSHIIMKSGNEMPRHIIVYLPLISLAIGRYFVVCCSEILVFIGLFKDYKSKDNKTVDIIIKIVWYLFLNSSRGAARIGVMGGWSPTSLPPSGGLILPLLSRQETTRPQLGWSACSYIKNSISVWTNLCKIKGVGRMYHFFETKPKSTLT